MNHTLKVPIPPHRPERDPKVMISLALAEMNGRRRAGSNATNSRMVTCNVLRTDGSASDLQM